MFEFLKKVFAREENSSRNKANDRLRLVLTHDRIGASSQLMETLQEEIIALIASHVEIEGTPEVHFITEGRRTALDISIPLKGR
ncbi:MAG: cell division topological specificity factor [Firmicutes bacterium HGW-Firmicutes-15]|nr:MAG: cell division topological specificity factor [Firmicutes bacterium HGW-Firmicutes-15]